MAPRPLPSGILCAIEGRVRAEWPSVFRGPPGSGVNVGNEPETGWFVLLRSLQLRLR